jgi:hypothetical protein
MHGIDPALRGARYDAGELGLSRFSVAFVHRVDILDVHLLNIDRHVGNILVKNPTSRQSACGRGASSVLLAKAKKIEGITV